MSRKNEILALIAKGEISDALFNELKQIKAAEDQAKAERQNQIASAIKGLVVSGVSFAELMDAQVEGQAVFKASDIIAYAQNKGLKLGKGGAGGTRTKKDLGMALFQFPAGIRGAGSKICVKSPRINLTKGMTDLVKKGGDLKSNLLALSVKTPEVQQFLSTTQGQAIIDAWVNFMKSKAA